jgi:hypothetical protein
MAYIESILQPGEELVYTTTPTRHFLRLFWLALAGVIFILLAVAVPVFMAYTTQRFGRFPVIWGLPDSVPVLIITLGLWLLPVLAFFIFSMEAAQIFACELAVTDRRILGRIPALWIFRQLELPINEIALVSQVGSRVVFKLKTGQLISVNGFQNAGQFVEVCRMRMIISISLATTALNRGDEPTQRLKRLREALDSGLISEIEYSEKRSEILKQM